MKYSNQRVVYGNTLVELGNKYKNIVVLEADLGKSTMSILFQQAFPERYFEMGIAEQNMASFAAGLAISGKVAFVNSFAVFASGRAYDQIRQSICIPSLNVKIIGSSSGLSDFGDGASHQAIEDLAIMRAIPNLTVLCPVDAIETRQMIETAYRTPGPFYIRICRNDLPEIYPEEQAFEIGKPVIIREGKDVVVFATGIMVSLALAASAKLQEKGIDLRIVNVSTLKPIRDEEFVSLAFGTKGVVTAEEHSLIGGLSSAVTFALRNTFLPVEAIGIEDKFGQSAQNYEELLLHYGLTEDEIIKAVERIFNGEL